MDKVNRNIICRVVEAIFFIATAIFQFALLANFVSVKQVGIFSFVFAWYSLFFALTCSFGIITITTRDLSQGDEVKSSLSNALALQLIICLIIGIISLPLICSLDYFSEIKWPLIIMFSIDLVILPAFIFQAVIQSKEDMHIIALINSVSYVLSVLAEYYVLKFGYPFIYIYLAIIFQVFMQALLGLYFARKDIFFSLTYVSFDKLKKLTYQILPVVMMAFVTMLYVRIDVMMLEYFRGKEEVAYYTYAYTFLDYIMIISNTIIGAIFPNITRYIKDDREMFNKLYKKVILIFIKYLFPLALLIAYFSDTLLELVYSKDYISGATSLSILMFAALFAFINGPSGSIFLGLKKQHIYLYGCIVSLLINILTNYFLIPIYGLNGAAIATLFTEVVLLSFCLIFIYKNLYSKSIN